MIRQAREGRRDGTGRTELQVHVRNRRAVEYYERLGMRRCRWWGRDGEQEGRRLCEDGGGSLYEPREGYQMMQIGERALESALRERALRREPQLQGWSMCGRRGWRDLGTQGCCRGYGRW